MSVESNPNPIREQGQTIQSKPQETGTKINLAPKEVISGAEHVDMVLKGSPLDTLPQRLQEQLTEMRSDERSHIKRVAGDLLGLKHFESSTLNPKLFDLKNVICGDHLSLSELKSLRSVFIKELTNQNLSKSDQDKLKTVINGIAKIIEYELIIISDKLALTLRRVLPPNFEHLEALDLLSHGAIEPQDLAQLTALRNALEIFVKDRKPKFAGIIKNCIENLDKAIDLIKPAPRTQPKSKDNELINVATTTMKVILSGGEAVLSEEDKQLMRDLLPMVEGRSHFSHDQIGDIMFQYQLLENQLIKNPNSNEDNDKNTFIQNFLKQVITIVKEVAPDEIKGFTPLEIEVYTDPKVLFEGFESVNTPVLESEKTANIASIMPSVDPSVFVKLSEQIPIMERGWPEESIDAFLLLGGGNPTRKELEELIDKVNLLPPSKEQKELLNILNRALNSLIPKFVAQIEFLISESKRLNLSPFQSHQLEKALKIIQEKSWSNPDNFEVLKYVKSFLMTTLVNNSDRTIDQTLISVLNDVNKVLNSKNEGSKIDSLLLYAGNDKLSSENRFLVLEAIRALSQNQPPENLQRITNALKIREPSENQVMIDGLKSLLNQVVKQPIRTSPKEARQFVEKEKLLFPELTRLEENTISPILKGDYTHTIVNDPATASAIGKIWGFYPRMNALLNKDILTREDFEDLKRQTTIIKGFLDDNRNVLKPDEIDLISKFLQVMDNVVLRDLKNLFYPEASAQVLTIAQELLPLERGYNVAQLLQIPELHLEESSIENVVNVVQKNGPLSKDDVQLLNDLKKYLAIMARDLGIDLSKESTDPRMPVIMKAISEMYKAVSRNVRSDLDEYIISFDSSTQKSSQSVADPNSTLIPSQPVEKQTQVESKKVMTDSDYLSVQEKVFSRIEDSILSLNTANEINDLYKLGRKIQGIADNGIIDTNDIGILSILSDEVRRVLNDRVPQERALIEEALGVVENLIRFYVEQSGSKPSSSESSSSTSTSVPFEALESTDTIRVRSHEPIASASEIASLVAPSIPQREMGHVVTERVGHKKTSYGEIQVETTIAKPINTDFEVAHILGMLKDPIPKEFQEKVRNALSTVPINLQALIDVTIRAPLSRIPGPESQLRLALGELVDKIQSKPISLNEVTVPQLHEVRFVGNDGNVGVHLARHGTITTDSQMLQLIEHHLMHQPELVKDGAFNMFQFALNQDNLSEMGVLYDRFNGRTIVFEEAGGFRGIDQDGNIHLSRPVGVAKDVKEVALNALLFVIPQSEEGEHRNEASLGQAEQIVSPGDYANLMMVTGKNAVLAFRGAKANAACSFSGDSEQIGAVTAAIIGDSAKVGKETLKKMMGKSSILREIPPPRTTALPKATKLTKPSFKFPKFRAITRIGRGNIFRSRPKEGGFAIETFTAKPVRRLKGDDRFA